jgi:hypothetical protein
MFTKDEGGWEWEKSRELTYVRAEGAESRSFVEVEWPTVNVCRWSWWLSESTHPSSLILRKIRTSILLIALERFLVSGHEISRILQIVWTAPASPLSTECLEY